MKILKLIWQIFAIWTLCFVVTELAAVPGSVYYPPTHNSQYEFTHFPTIIGHAGLIHDTFFIPMAPINDEIISLQALTLKSKNTPAKKVHVKDFKEIVWTNIANVLEQDQMRAGEMFANLKKLVTSNKPLEITPTFVKERHRRQLECKFFFSKYIILRRFEK